MGRGGCQNLSNLRNKGCFLTPRLLTLHAHNTVGVMDGLSSCTKNSKNPKGPNPPTPPQKKSSPSPDFPFKQQK